jgi:hypothetical protein
MKHRSTAATLLALALLASAALAQVVSAQHAPTQHAPTQRGEQAQGAEVVYSAQQRQDGARAWVKVAQVLQSPRCMNCHPDGDSPLQTDQSRPHAMNISRRSVDNGLTCATCHREENSDAMGIIGGPPGAPNWHLPDAQMPLIFQGRSVAQLCAQLKDPAQNGHKTLEQLLHHVSHDPLVLWGWDPGAGRSEPPLSHEAFVASFKVWVESGGACPGEDKK